MKCAVTVLALRIIWKKERNLMDMLFIARRKYVVEIEHAARGKLNI
jgi:hypothetical protein